MGSSEEKETLKAVVTLLHKHDTKLSLDYASIQRLEKDTDKLAQSTSSLAKSVAEISGTVKTQANVVNGVLAVTVIAFLSFAIKSIYEPNRPDPRVFADELASVMQRKFDVQETSRVHKKIKVVTASKKGDAGPVRTTP
jgi:Tfp pilus assembly protein PilN